MFSFFDYKTDQIWTREGKLYHSSFVSGLVVALLNVGPIKASAPADPGARYNSFSLNPIGGSSPSVF
jgi:hypothetical protein